MEVQIIIGTDKEQLTKTLSQCLIENGYIIAAECNNGQDILRRLTTHKVDLVILEPSIKGGSSKELSDMILHSYNTPVIVLANDAEASKFYDMTFEFGFACIQKPLSKQALLQSIMLLINSMQTVKKLKAEVTQLEQKLGAQNILERAKRYLMEHYSLSENEAHRYIQKKSMNSKRTKEDIAKEILRG